MLTSSLLLLVSAGFSSFFISLVHSLPTPSSLTAFNPNHSTPVPPTTSTIYPPHLTSVVSSPKPYSHDDSSFTSIPQTDFSDTTVPISHPKTTIMVQLPGLLGFSGNYEENNFQVFLRGGTFRNYCDIPILSYCNTKNPYTKPQKESLKTLSWDHDSAVMEYITNDKSVYAAPEKNSNNYYSDDPSALSTTTPPSNAPLYEKNGFGFSANSPGRDYWLFEGIIDCNLYPVFEYRFSIKFFSNNRGVDASQPMVLDPVYVAQCGQANRASLGKTSDI